MGITLRDSRVGRKRGCLSAAGRSVQFRPPCPHPCHASREFVLTLSCRDAKGIVFAVSGLLYQAGCNIVDSQQFGDLPDETGVHSTGLFFMRVHFEAPPHLANTDTLDTLFTSVRQQFGMEAQLHSLARRPRLLLMVSQHGHCLNDLLYRWHSGQLNVDIPAIVSNHPTFADLAARYGIPFHHLPLATGASAEAKRAQEQQVEALVSEHQIDLVVLARYMQILSPAFCSFLQGPGDQHPPQLPAQLQGRQALLPGARPRREADRRDRPLRDGRARRRPHHRAGRGARGPLAQRRRLHRRRPRRREHGAGARRALACGAPRAAERPEDRDLPLTHDTAMARPKPPDIALMASPDDTEAQFYEALQRGDIDKLMAVWSDDDDICCVHPNGPRVVGAGGHPRGLRRDVFQRRDRRPPRDGAPRGQPTAARCTAWSSASR